MDSLKLGLMMSVIVLAMACGKNDDEATMPTQAEVDPGNLRSEVMLKTKLFPVNTNLNFPEVGSAQVSKKSDTFSASVILQYGSPTVWHQQGIYTGERCPTLKDDLNKDAYIDIIEAKAAIGAMIIPLDADLNSQYGGWSMYPTGKVEGGYEWENSASVAKLMEDLRTPNNEGDEDLARLGARENLKLEGRVVIIQGTDRDFLPETVEMGNNPDRQSSLPVACGVLGL